MKLGFWVSQNFWRSTCLFRPQFHLPLSIPLFRREHACMQCTMQSTCVSSAVLGDFTRCQTPGEPSAGALLGLDSLSFALQLARQSILPSLHPPYLLSPCWVISQWASNYSDWHVVRSCVRYIYLIYKQKILQWIIQKEIITFMVHFPNPRLCL